MTDAAALTLDSTPGIAAAPTAAPSPPLGTTIPYDRFLDCVHCGLCTSACPTYLESGDENDSPRGRIYLMRAVTDGRLAMTDKVRRHLDLCLDCRSCETACPSGVQYGRLIEPFRVELQADDAQRGRDASKGWFHRFILYGLFPYPNRLRWALLPARMLQLLRLDTLADALRLTRLLPGKLRRMQALLPRLQPRPKPLPDVLPALGKTRARVALFTGCVAEAMFAETNRATARVLQHNGCEVIVPKTQVCCGAIHYHSGAGEPALKRAETNVAAFNPDDVDAVIINVAGCGSMLKDYGHIAEELSPGDGERRRRLAKFADKVKDVSEFLMELGPIPPAGEVKLKATYHDACHLVHAQQVRNQPRELLALVPGLELLPLAESDICCGAAGSYNLTEPQMADRLGERKLRNILDTQADAVILGNAGCSLQIQSAIRRAGRDIPVLHPMDVLDRSYRGRTAIGTGR
ncbi:MAG: (Fe-S)-binding protein [Planctomycetaceae bacterium]